MEVYRLELSVRLKGEELDRDLAAILKWPWKLIVDSRGERALYDLATDPEESFDLADQRVKRAAVLEQRLNEVRSRIVAPPVKPLEVDDEMKNRLKELGYSD